MGLILSLETSTKNCSVSLSQNGEVLALVEESSHQYIHSEKLHVFIAKAMEEAGKQLTELQAVAVGKGPGSYTGLRIGVSAAKGLCYALNVPLISEDGLQIMVNDFLSGNQIGDNEAIIPMLDARRMEVYCALHTADGTRSGKIEAKVIDEDSFTELTAEKIRIIGDAAEKCRNVLRGEKFVFHNLPYPSARALAKGAFQKLRTGNFEDVAYFEPFYLKDFVAGKPKKLL